MPFSDLVGLFKSAFDASQFLPSLLASLGAVWGMPLIVDKGDPFQVMRDLLDYKTTDKVVIALAAAVIVSVVFRILRRSIVRLLEGYLPIRRVWAPFEAYQRWRRARWVAERDRLAALENRSSEEQVKLNRLALRIDLRCARSPRATLGTRMGNAYRAFEGYPNERYGFDGVALWPRIQPLLADSARENVTAGQSTVDLLLTSTVLAFLAGIAVFLVEPPDLRTVVLVGSFVVGARLLYLAAVESVIALGYAIRAGFDLGRLDFLKAMGYEPPDTLQDEKRLWGEVSRFLVYNTPMTTPRKPPAASNPEPKRPSFFKALLGAALALVGLRAVLKAASKEPD